MAANKEPQGNWRNLMNLEAKAPARMSLGHPVVLTMNLTALHPATPQARPATLAEMIIVQATPKRPTADHLRLSEAMTCRLLLLIQMVPFTMTKQKGHLEKKLTLRMIVTL
jgi:hypothetical protein